MSDLKALFLSFAGYGKGQQSVGEMDGARLIKLCKDCKFVGKDLSTTDIDLIFAKVKAKGERKIGLEQFKQALELIAAKKKKSVDKLVGMMQASNGPVTNATKAEAVKFHDDKSLYTGVHANGGPCTGGGPQTLSGLLDRSAADVRGVKK